MPFETELLYGINSKCVATCLIHEYVHAIAHTTREERDAWTRDEREWQAESVAFVVCSAIGVVNVNSRDYLLSYRLTTDKLADMMKLIQALTKKVMQDLDLLQPKMGCKSRPSRQTNKERDWGGR